LSARYVVLDETAQDVLLPLSEIGTLCAGHLQGFYVRTATLP
jgi:hypothetical protein